MGIRFRARVELPRRLRRLPAAQARDGGPDAVDPYRAGRRLRAARAMTIRRRLSLAAAVAVAVAVAVACAAAYVGVRAKMRGEIDHQLGSRAAAVQTAAAAFRRGTGLPLPPPLGDALIPEPRIERFGGAGGAIQFISPAGAPTRFPAAAPVMLP